MSHLSLDCVKFLVICAVAIVCISQIAVNKIFMKSEFEFIETIRRRFNLSKIGDDCAVLPKDSKTDSVITTDLLIEDIDFRLNWTIPEFLGHKSLAISLSDVAAMGAKPVWLKNSPSK